MLTTLVTQWNEVKLWETIYSRLENIQMKWIYFNWNDAQYSGENDKEILLEV